MLVCRAASFIYWDNGLELAKFPFKSVDCLDPFDLQGDYHIGKTFVGNCWLCYVLWDECTKMYMALTNKFDIIIHLEYLKGMEMHYNVL